jgi:nicotinic acid mononucleotide adenylyltransferase
LLLYTQIIIMKIYNYYIMDFLDQERERERERERQGPTPEEPGLRQGPNPEHLGLINDSTIIFTIARMNPPTPGHLLLIQRLIQHAIQLQVPKVYVILSKSNSDNENPIDCLEKIKVLSGRMIYELKQQMKQQMKREGSMRSELIDAIEVVLICTREDQSSPISPLIDIVNTYSRLGIQHLNLFMIVGADRADFLETIVDAFLLKNLNINSVDGQILPREDMASFKSLSEQALSLVNISEMPQAAFSASFVRKLVNFELKDKFVDVYRPFLDELTRNELYDLIKEGLNKPAPKSKPVSKLEERQIYQYPFYRDTPQFVALVEQKAAEDAERKRIKAEKDRIKAERERIKAERALKTAAETSAETSAAALNTSAETKRISKERALKTAAETTLNTSAAALNTSAETAGPVLGKRSRNRNTSKGGKNKRTNKLTKTKIKRRNKLTKRTKPNKKNKTNKGHYKK